MERTLQRYIKEVAYEYLRKERRSSWPRNAPNEMRSLSNVECMLVVDIENVIEEKFLEKKVFGHIPDKVRVDKSVLSHKFPQA